ncbi:hypothetical protein OZ668_14420 [Elizabethkingia sp. HX XZB]|uniref:hypothetical protein n=1 Tax=Elizabethkingia sp. HX XZB TaxID=3003193 RepID=UPI002A24B09D|nr:hypothetical protein [Elizabethkingia sp. HX XZB]MDX8569192.1 hypothetical protein [Elizabethkingia sp. HX XZB]
MKRKLKIKEVSFWDYLITIIIPICLLVCGIIAENKGNIMAALGIGYTIVILSYNRINILKINLSILFICLLLALIAFLMIKNNQGYQMPSGLNNFTTLYFPILAYIFVQSSRAFIRMALKTYPIIVGKDYPIGRFYPRYNRNVNYWDLIWTILCIFAFPSTFVLLFLY